MRDENSLNHSLFKEMIFSKFQEHFKKLLVSSFILTTLLCETLAGTLRRVTHTVTWQILVLKKNFKNLFFEKKPKNNNNRPRKCFTRLKVLENFGANLPRPADVTGLKSFDCVALIAVLLIPSTHNLNTDIKILFSNSML